MTFNWSIGFIIALLVLVIAIVFMVVGPASLTPLIVLGLIAALAAARLIP